VMTAIVKLRVYILPPVSNISLVCCKQVMFVNLKYKQHLTTSIIFNDIII